MMVLFLVRTMRPMIIMLFGDEYVVNAAKMLSADDDLLIIVRCAFDDLASQVSVLKARPMRAG